MTEPRAEYRTEGDEAKPSKIVPNTFQTPNVLVDEYMGYLSGNETKCYLIVDRKTLGWLKRTDCISLSQIMQLARISEATARDCVRELCKYGLVIKVADNDPAKNFGDEYALQMDDTKIDLPGLWSRANDLHVKAVARMGKARLKRKNDTPPNPLTPRTSGHDHPGVSGLGTQKPLSKATIKKTERPDFQNLLQKDYRTVPELKVFMDATGWMPGSFVLEAVYDLIRDGNLKGETIKIAFTEWNLRGYNPGNVKGYLGWARDGVPETRSDKKAEVPKKQAADPFASLNAYLESGA